MVLSGNSEVVDDEWVTFPLNRVDDDLLSEAPTSCVKLTFGSFLLEFEEIFSLLVGLILRPNRIVFQ